MKEFKGKLGNYKIIKTEDDTETIWSEYFDENCHNTSGAKLETIHNYIEGCEIELFQNKFDQVNILDVGFGPGFGLLYLSEFKNVNYYSIELDPELVYWALKNTFNNPEYNLITNNDLEYISFKFKNINCLIFIGDGRITIPKAFEHGLISPLHAIFQDPFSPKKNPTLWTVEWFTQLIKMSHFEVIMSTYSSSVSIRKSMLEAGFKIENRKGFAKKRSMTRARLSGESNPELLLELNRSPILSLRDN